MSKTKLPYLAQGELDKFQELYFKTTRTSSGNPPAFIASPSGYIYNTAGTPYDNLGENGLMSLIYFGNQSNPTWEASHYVLQNHSADEAYFADIEDNLLKLTDESIYSPNSVTTFGYDLNNNISTITTTFSGKVHELTTFTYTSGLVTNINTKIYESDGTTIKYQSNTVPAYSGTKITSMAKTEV